jgi:hypothetical protein
VTQLTVAASVLIQHFTAPCNSSVRLRAGLGREKARQTDLPLTFVVKPHRGVRRIVALAGVSRRLRLRVGQLELDMNANAAPESEIRIKAFPKATTQTIGIMR